MRNLIITQLRSLNVIDDNKLIEYVDFCLSNHDVNGNANHHILPRANFKQFSNLRQDTWNLSRLSYKNHYYAHFLFCLAIDDPSQNAAFAAINNKDMKLGRLTKDDLIDPEYFQIIMERRDRDTSIRNSGKVVAKDLSTGKTISIAKEEFDKNDNLVGHTIGKSAEHLKDTIPVLDENGELIRIKCEDFNSEIHTKFRTKTVCVKDKDGNTLLVQTDDKRYIDGELIHINKGKKFPDAGKKISKSRKESGLAKGSNNPRARKIQIFDSDDNLVVECYGDSAIKCAELGISCSTVSNSCRSGKKMFSTKHMQTYAKNKGLEKFINWYAKYSDI